MENELSLYEVTYRRGRRSWQEQERYDPVLLFKEYGKPLPRPQSASRPIEGLPGTLAVTAWTLWNAVATTTELPAQQRQRMGQRAELVRGLVVRQAPTTAVNEALGEMLHHRVQWLPALPEKQDLIMRWAITASAHEPFPVVAVYLSVIHGLRAQTLRVCSRCSSPFVAKRGPGKLCDTCYRLRQRMPHSKRPTWDLFEDRLRKNPKLDTQQRRSAWRKAATDLFAISLEEWQKKWDQRSPRGRPRKRV